MLTMHCPRCGAPSDLDVCLCCDVVSVLCHSCELLLGRYDPDEFVRELDLTIPGSATPPGETRLSPESELRRV